MNSGEGARTESLTGRALGFLFQRDEKNATAACMINVAGRHCAPCLRRGFSPARRARVCTLICLHEARNAEATRLSRLESKRLGRADVHFL